MSCAFLLEDFTGTPWGTWSLVTFVVAYALVVTEDLIKLRKSKPVVLAAGVIWILVAMALKGSGLDIEGHDVADRVRHHVSDFAELFLFLTVAMTYISAIAERNVFLKINAWLVSGGYGLRAVFWTTGALAFAISPIADNLTTALLMGAVVVTVGRGNPKFVAIACANVVIAANAGGAFSPFGDITTLMVWQAGHVATLQFLLLIPASLVNWLVPAVIMSMTIPSGQPERMHQEVELKEGWLLVVVLFLLTIATAVTFHGVLHLPPFLGMTTGLGIFFLYGYFKRLRDHRLRVEEPVDVFKNVADVEWDTLLFFFGVIMCVGGLREFGYLAKASSWLYGDLGPTWANIGVGVISAILDNVPVMFSVLGMDPDLDTKQWLLVTLTAGVGGSLLSVGSAAGVALMGTAHGKYTFTSHLKWLPAIALGYAGSIAVHILLYESFAE